MTKKKLLEKFDLAISDAKADKKPEFSKEKMLGFIAGLENGKALVESLL